MRVVEFEKKAATPKFWVVLGTGAAAGVAAVVMCVLLIINNVQLRRADPMNTPALTRLLNELSTSPQDEELRAQIRELDLLARRAYFAGESFNHTGITLLLICLAVMVGMLKYAGYLNKGVPYPNSADPKRDLAADGRFMRRAFGAGWLVLIGFTLAVAIPWESPLEGRSSTDAAAVAGKSTPGSSAAAAIDAAPLPTSTTPTTPSASLPPLPAPSAEQRLANWPGFLGPAPGLAQGSGPGDDWSVERSVVWKAPLPSPGFGSPIVWDGSVFLSGGSGEGLDVYCFDAATGAQRWRHVVVDVAGSPPEAPEVSTDTGYAAATMATDGNYVFAIFANGDLVALDFAGRRVWARNLGLPDNPYGHASSLLVHDDLLLVQYDQRADARFLGLDLRDGTTRWETPRELGPSWASPLLLEQAGTTEVVLVAAGAVVSFDPKDGTERWRVECLEGAEVACTPAQGTGMLYVSADYAGLTAIDLETHEVAWHYEDLVPGVSTPLVVGEYLVAGLSDGGIVCLNAATGEEVWFEITDDGFYASPVLVGDAVHMLDRVGRMHIFRVGPEFTAVADPALDEEAICTPAFVGSSMYVRGASHLFRIGS